MGEELMKKPHQPIEVEKKILAFLEKNRGQVLDDEIMGKFATLLWKELSAYTVEVMRAVLKDRKK